MSWWSFLLPSRFPERKQAQMVAVMTTAAFNASAAATRYSLGSIHSKALLPNGRPLSSAKSRKICVTSLLNNASS